MNYIKAESKSLLIGNLEFDAIRIIETGEYRMSQKQVLGAVGEERNWLTRLQVSMPEMYQKLICQGFNHVTVGVQFVKMGKNGRQVVTRSQSLSIKDVRVIWRFLDKTYRKPQAEKLIDALSEDSLQDRFESVWKERRSSEKRRADDSRILDNPEPWSPMFEEAFEIHLERITGLHKCHIRNSRFYWEFIYRWLTVEERAKLDEINPVLPGGRRRHKIHTCIEQSTKDRLRGHIQTIYALMRSANSVAELRRMVQRQDGFDQGDLFDGWAA